MTISRRFWVASLGLAAASCGEPTAHTARPASVRSPQDESASKAATPHSARPLVEPEAALLTQLSLSATGQAPPADELRRSLAGLSAGTLTVERHIDELLSRPGFFRTVGPSIVVQDWALHSYAYVENQYIDSFVLKRRVAPVETLYLRAKCSPEEAVRVVPWWAPDREVSVCPEAYQPEHFVEPDTGWSCDGILVGEDLVNHPWCGCGPALMRCYPDRESFVMGARSAIDEVIDTVSWNIRSDLPLTRAFTDNETVRSRHAEFRYRRWRVEDGEPASVLDLPSLAAWPSAPAHRPRHESAHGEHAGVLTTEFVAFIETGLRPTLKNVFGKLWCKEPDGASVSTAAMLELAKHGADVRAGSGWRELAQRPICETCHARLDYAMQFFAGFPDVRSSGHFTRSRQLTGIGPFYIDDARDLRGHAALNPRAFAEAAVREPEFAACMVKRVVEHVFNHQGSAEGTRAVAAAFSVRPTLREMMKVALLRYATDRLSTRPPEPDPSPAIALGDSVSLTPALQALVRERCLDCHSQPGDLDFGTPLLPRARALRMLDAVSSGRMPEQTPLDRVERDRFIRGLVPALWPNSGDAASARAYFETFLRALPIHRASAALQTVRDRAGGTVGRQWQTIEHWQNGSLRQYSPGFATVLGLEALRSCKEAGRTGAQLDDCIEWASDPTFIISAHDIAADGIPSE